MIYEPRVDFYKIAINKLITKGDKLHYKISYWDDDNIKCRFIESIFLNFPLMNFCFHEQGDQLVVLDGNKRLTALFDYHSDKYAVRMPYGDYIKYYYGELPTNLQRKFNWAYLHCAIVDGATNREDVINRYY